MMRSSTVAPYCSRDVLTEPPTTVTIVSADSLPAEIVAGDAPFFKISEADVEPTDGWRSRHGKSQLSICFMHSFGKCSGRVARDPSTCHQIHIRREALDALRAQYKHKVRTFFCRTIKAHLQLPLREMLSRIAKKDLTLKYLEYRTQDVEPTDALFRYEQSYRLWLQAGNDPTAAAVPFPDAAVEQCTAFAVDGVCPKGSQCDAVHCHVAAAQVRDRAVSAALQQLHRPPSFASFVQQQTNYPVFSAPMPAQTAPVYVVVFQPQESHSNNGSNVVPSTPPSSSSLPNVQSMAAAPFLKDPFSVGSRAVTPNADLSSAGALTPSHSSGAFDRNTSSAFFSVPSESTPQMSFQLLPPAAASQPTATNDIFLSFRNHFSATVSPSKASPSQ